MVIIVLEFTGSYEFALASIITVAMSSFISTRIFSYSFFDHQLLMRGFDLRQGRETLSLTDVSVATLSLEKRTPVGKKTEGLSLVNTLVRDQKTEAYIVDGNDKLIGRATIVSALKNEDKPADAFMESDYAYLSTDDNLQVALLTAREFVGEAIPVVDVDGVFIGCLSEGDILGGTMDWQENVKGYERN
jgi:CIC family chloride channel protein